MKKRFLPLIVALFNGLIIFAQNVTVDTANNAIDTTKVNIIDIKFDSTNIEPDTFKIVADTTTKTIVQKNDSVVKPLTTEPQIAEFDQIIKTTGEVFNVIIVEKTVFEVSFYYPLNKEVSKLNTANIKEIRYKDGKVETISQKIEQKPKDWVIKEAEKDYDKVEVFYEADQVAGMKELGTVVGEYVGRKFNVTNSIIEKSGLIVVKRKALRMNATAILIIEKHLSRDYGELPSIYIKAIAYSKE